MKHTGGTSPKRSWRRATEGDYFRWRTKVLVRDGNLCQACGEEGGPRGRGLHVHHLLSYARYPSLRYDVGNGVALCMACHRKLHEKKVPTDPIPCACGCGTMIMPFDAHRKRPRHYVNGHASRGAKRSAIARAAISAAKAGVAQTAEANAKRSAALKGRAVSEETRARMSKGISRSRRESADRVTFGDRSMSLKDWADATGIPYDRLWHRLGQGWSVERALTTSVRPKRR